MHDISVLSLDRFTPFRPLWQVHASNRKFPSLLELDDRGGSDLKISQGSSGWLMLEIMLGSLLHIHQ
jgi:hypothetical protein